MSLPQDRDEFGQLLETHRRDLVVLCYRFLGSVQDAEDAAQEAFLRAWRARQTFRGHAGIRTWLHRIATRVCLDALERRRTRQMPQQLGPAADAATPPTPPTHEILWLEPLPDTYLADGSLDPAARYSLRESVALAFTAALQTLPVRQRAVLLLRDVLAWHADEVADALDMSVPAVNSALNRARHALAAHHETDRPTPITGHARLLDAYVRAWETDDVHGLVSLLQREVRLAMPPSPAWYVGRDAVIELLGRWVLPMGRFRLAVTGANLQPAVILWLTGADGVERPVGVQVFTFVAGKIATIDAFMDARVAERFIVAE